MYIGTTVLMYEIWLVLKAWYTAGHLAGRRAEYFHIAYACESKMMYKR